MKAILPLALVASLSLNACGAPAPATAEFRRLATAAEPEATICQTFERKYERERQLLSNDTVPYASKKEALVALTLLENRPIEFPHSEKATAYFLEHHEELLASWDPFVNLANRALAGSLTGDCFLFFPMGALPKLSREASALGFSATEKMRLQNAYRTFLFSHLPKGRLGIIGFAAQNYVLESYLAHHYAGESRAALLAEAQALQQNFEQERRQVLGRPGGILSEYWEYATNRRMRAELNWRLNFGRRFETLLKKAFSSGKTPIPNAKT